MNDSQFYSRAARIAAVAAADFAELAAAAGVDSVMCNQASTRARQMSHWSSVYSQNARAYLISEEAEAAP